MGTKLLLPSAKMAAISLVKMAAASGSIPSMLGPAPDNGPEDSSCLLAADGRAEMCPSASVTHTQDECALHQDAASIWCCLYGRGPLYTSSVSLDPSPFLQPKLITSRSLNYDPRPVPTQGAMEVKGSLYPTVRSTCITNMPQSAANMGLTCG